MTDGGDDATKTIHPPAGDAGQVPADERPLARGTEVGRYVVLSVVGGGGMGFVYSAFDPELDRRVALKLLRRTAAAPDAHARLLREAQAMARLNHPNVVAVHDAGMHGGRVFLAMEYVPGVTLREWLQQKPRSWREKLYVLAEAGRGLAAAHAAHLVHRDVKPANIIVGEDGRVRVTDFGIARNEAEVPAPSAAATSPAPSGDSLAHMEKVHDASWSEALTREGAVVGTLGYLSPEQAESRPSDARTDQFSFCVTAWEVLYGQRPFPRDSVEGYIKALLDGSLLPPPGTTDVPRRVLAALRKGLQVAPAARFASMDALLAELGRDPSRRLWALAPWALLLTVLVGLVAAQSVSAARRARACTGFVDRLSGRWDEDGRARLQTAFDAVKTPWAADVHTSIARGLDAWTAAWLAQKQAACEATYVEGRQPEEVLALRDTCLDRRLEELGALTEALAEVEPAAADKVLSAVYALRPPALCADASRLRAEPTAQDARAVRESLDKGLVRLELGQVDRAQPFLEAAVKNAQLQKLPALGAEALLGLALLQQQKAAFDDAHATNLQALRLALAAGLDELVARAALRLALIEGFHLEKPKEARDWLAVIDGAIERLSGDATLSMQRLQTEGVLAFAAGDPLAAAKHHEAAVELGRATLGETHPALWKAYLDLGASYVASRQWRKAVPMLEKALHQREAAVGQEHPEVALVLSNLGTARFYAGDAEGSAQAFARSLAVREKILGPDSPRLVPLLGNMGDTALRSGQLDRARVHLARAEALAEKAFGPTHTYTLVMRINHAWLRLAEGQVTEARAGVDEVLRAAPVPPLKAEALALSARVWLKQGKPKLALADAGAGVTTAERIGPESAEVMLPLLAQGEALLALGRTAGARGPLDRALAVAGKTGAWPVHQAQVQLALARALETTDPARALGLAGEAAKVLEAAPGQAAGAQAAGALVRALTP